MGINGAYIKPIMILSEIQFTYEGGEINNKFAPGINPRHALDIWILLFNNTTNRGGLFICKTYFTLVL